MLTIKEAATKAGVSEATFREWCQKGYIRGAEYDASVAEYRLPVHFKLPYTARKKGKGDAIYISIVKGIMQGRDVCGALYAMSEKEFQGYIRELKKAGVIDTYREGKITYYRQTLQSSSFAKLRGNRVKAFLASLLKLKPDIHVNVGMNVK